MNKEINFYRLNENNYKLRVLHTYSVPNNKYSEKTGILIMQKGYNLGLFDVEHVYLMSTNDGNHINGIINIADGNDHHVDIHISNVISYLSFVNASGFAMYHNHPNNLVYPSNDDYISAETMENLARTLNITFYGSYILGFDQYCEVSQNKAKKYIYNKKIGDHHEVHNLG